MLTKTLSAPRRCRSDKILGSSLMFRFIATKEIPILGNLGTFCARSIRSLIRLLIIRSSSSFPRISEYASGQFRHAAAAPRNRRKILFHRRKILSSRFGQPRKRKKSCPLAILQPSCCGYRSCSSGGILLSVRYRACSAAEGNGGEECRPAVIYLMLKLRR